MKCPYNTNMLCNQVNTAGMTMPFPCYECKYFPRQSHTILRPVQIRAPEINKSVPVLIQDNEKFFYATCHLNHGSWFFSEIAGVSKIKLVGQRLRVVCWYEEVFVEFIFPDEDAGYLAAKNASNDNIRGTGLHQEGQTYAKNQFIRNLMR